MSSGSLSNAKWNAEQQPATMARSHLDGVSIAMLVLTSFLFVSRIIVRVSQGKAYELHDFFCHSSFICYIAMWVMYTQENDPLYRVEGVQRCEIAPYPEILHDAGMIYRWMTSGQLLFYAPLTLVKLSLLALYRRLLDRTPTKYVIMWWGILTFCILSFIGSSMTTIFVCDDQQEKYNLGMCAKPNEQKRALLSLWFAYAVDVATDLAVMFLPFRLTWSLELPRTQKLGVFVLFGSGWICILFATLRVVQVGVKNGVPSTPDPKWLQIWTVIEISMAVIVGCTPAFASIIRSQFDTPDVSYNSRGYVKRSTDNVKMKSLESGDTGRRKWRDEILWTDGHGSEEALADLGGLTTVTTTKVQDDDSSARLSTRANTQLQK